MVRGHIDKLADKHSEAYQSSYRKNAEAAAGRARADAQTDVTKKAAYETQAKKASDEAAAARQSTVDLKRQGQDPNLADLAKKYDSSGALDRFNQIGGEEKGLRPSSLPSGRAARARAGAAHAQHRELQAPPGQHLQPVGSGHGEDCKGSPKPHRQERGRVLQRRDSSIGTPAYVAGWRRHPSCDGPAAAGT